MNILPNIQIIDLALYLKKEKILIIADLHFGIEEALNKQGILIPRFQFNQILNRLENISNKVEIEKIVITGDLKHEFGIISEQEWRDILQLFDFFKDKEIILVKGNHDKALDYIADKRNIKVKEFYNVNDICILHGDKVLKNKEFLNSKIIVMGHVHPAVRFKGRSDKFKCFLLGKWKDKRLIVIPSMNQLAVGSDISKEFVHSPFLEQNLDNFEVYIVEDKVYKPLKLKSIVSA